MRACTFLLLVAAFASLPAFAAEQVYKWVDSHGTVHYADTPPANGAPYQVLDLAIPDFEKAHSTAAQPDSGTATPTDDDSGTPDDASQASTQAKGADAGRNNLCAKLRSNIKLLQSHQVVVAKDAKGAEKVMDAKTRQQQLATNQRQYKQNCQS